MVAQQRHSTRFIQPNITTNNLTNPASQRFSGVFPDPTIQAPFEVGDWITFAGTLVRTWFYMPAPRPDRGREPLTPTFPPTPSVNNAAIYTFQGSNPSLHRD